MRRVYLLPILAALLTMVVTGCRTRDFRTEDDALRARIVELEREVSNLERRNAELRAELRRQERVDVTPSDVAEHAPQVVEIAFARFTHARDTTRDGVPNELRVYLQPRDGRGRFVQVTGELTVTAALMPAEPGIDPVVVGRMTLGPAELRDTYRSGFMGVYYAAVMPIGLPYDAPDQMLDFERLMVDVMLVDGITGETHRAEQMVSLRP